MVKKKIPSCKDEAAHPPKSSEHNDPASSMCTPLVPVIYQEGEIIIEEGKRGSCAFRILEGTVEVIRYRIKGEVKLAELREGAIFGEMSLIDKKPYSATVKAASEVRLIPIKPEIYTSEINKASPIMQELMLAFSKRLRNADHTMVVLSEAEKKQRRIAELSRKELSVITHVAHTGVCLQNVFAWDEAYKVVENSLLKLGFTELELHVEHGNPGGKDSIELTAQEKEGDRYEIHFYGGKHAGRLRLLSPGEKMKDCYRSILMLYNSLLSSCLAKSEAYEAFTNISQHVESYLSDTRIREVANELKSAIDQFSTRNLDVLMAIPDRLSAGENIDDITFELTMGFQEIDRMVQEVDLICQVFNNIFQIAKGQLPDEVSNYDKYIDKAGDQSIVDDIFSGDKSAD